MKNPGIFTPKSWLYTSCNFVSSCAQQNVILKLNQILKMHLRFYTRVLLMFACILFLFTRILLLFIWVHLISTLLSFFSFVLLVFTRTLNRVLVWFKYYDNLQKRVNSCNLVNDDDSAILSRSRPFIG